MDSALTSGVGIYLYEQNSSHWLRSLRKQQFYFIMLHEAGQLSYSIGKMHINALPAKLALSRLASLTQTWWEVILFGCEEQRYCKTALSTARLKTWLWRVLFIYGFIIAMHLLYMPSLQCEVLHILVKSDFFLSWEDFDNKYTLISASFILCFGSFTKSLASILWIPFYHRWPDPQNSETITIASSHSHNVPAKLTPTNVWIFTYLRVPTYTYKYLMSPRRRRRVRIIMFRHICLQNYWS